MMMKRASCLIFLFIWFDGLNVLKPLEFPHNQNTHPVILYKQHTEDNGKAIYIKNCLSCHQSDGNGVPQMYPPLLKSNWLSGDKNKLIKVLVYGLNGEIEVNGEFYDQTMPKFDYLNDSQISDVLKYIMKFYGNISQDVTVKEVSNIRTSK